ASATAGERLLRGGPQERNHDLVMARQLDAAAAGGGRARDDVHARAVLAVEVHVDGGEVAHRVAEVAGQVERLHEDLGEDDGRAEVQVDAARKARHHPGEQVKIPQAAEPD